MKAERDAKTGKWLVQYRYTDYRGQRKKSTKRGFRTKKEAEEWLRDFLAMKQSSLSMTFSSFLELYYADMGKRLRENTMRTKKYIMDIKILPYFGEKSMCDIRATDIRAWQNELMEQEFAPTYLKTIQNQLSAVFNYAVRYYDLPSNPCLKAGSMGKSRAEEMDFWTKDEFMRFSDSVMDKRMSYMAFLTLYWTGMRLGELLALTWRDIDLEMKTISINKSYQRIGRRDVITPPKTSKGKRVIRIPEFLTADLRDFQDSLYDVKEDDRVFPVTKYYLEHEIERGAKKSGGKRLNIYSLRHPYVKPTTKNNSLQKQKSQTTNDDSLGFLYLSIRLVQDHYIGSASQCLVFSSVTLLVFFCSELTDSVC